ncbi:MAG: glutathione S-transferase family protein [Oceanospirillaceae bacterium]
MKLYYTPGTISLAVHIALEMSGEKYQSIAIDFSKSEQKSATFLALNPLGRVPALVTAQGVITEALAILNYIVAQGVKNHSELAASSQCGNFFQAKVDSFNSYMSSTVHVGHAHLRRPERWVDNESSKVDMAKKTPRNITEYYNIIENDLFVGPWVHGEQFSSSDIYLFVVTRWLLGDGVDPQQFKKVYIHFEKMSEMKEVKELLVGYYA